MYVISKARQKNALQLLTWPLESLILGEASHSVLRALRAHEKKSMLKARGLLLLASTSYPGEWVSHLGSSSPSQAFG